MVSLLFFVVTWIGFAFAVDNKHIPSVGVGTAALGNSAFDTVCNSLKAGFLLIDTAQAPEWYNGKIDYILHLHRSLLINSR